ncbi:MAG: hypothetical protein J5784_03995 [Muribaculaceae bacterium]|nr:hypothetical protein [Muribaculaceae bacterium]MBR4722851.1 hypothetical protein [Muribaculaceae bacterium]MBR5743803.1 hypothetical protein [Muribaculaceae bacterium]
MTTTNYQREKNLIQNLPLIYRQVRRNEIVALPENHYAVGNTEFKAPDIVGLTIDSFLGISSRQRKIANESYGTTGLTNLRNFFGQAKASSAESLVLIADPTTGELASATTIEDEVITPSAFFEFADVFMDKNGYEPYKIAYTPGAISLLLTPVKPQFRSFFKDDEFLANGVAFKWNIGEISMANFYERLVCVNGQIQQVEGRHTRINSTRPAEMTRLLDLDRLGKVFDTNIDKMIGKAQEASGTMASVNEVGRCYNILLDAGATEETAEKMIPYNEIVGIYKTAGYDTKPAAMSLAKSNINVWDLYNRLTYFASHNESWPENDIRSAILMEEGVKFLMRTRDIKEYVDVFSELD